jgi:penicillin-binding protein 2
VVVEDTPDLRKTVTDVAELAGENADELYERVSRQTKRRRFEPKVLLRDVSRDLVGAISAQRHRLPGVVVGVAPARQYAFGDLAAHLVGYIREISGEQLKNPNYSGYRSGDMIGQSGVESSLERYLRGERGVQAVIVNALGSKIGEAYVQPEIPGNNVFLTIDRKLQKVADDSMIGKKGAVVVMSAKTGDILAISSAPRFEPAIFTGEISKDVWSDLTDPKAYKLSNRALQGAFPPGSVFKIFVAAAALSEGVTDTREKTFCPGFLQFGKRAFRCHKHSGHGRADLFESIVQSCDVFFYTIGQRLGVDRIHYYARELFGFGEPVGLAGMEESVGLVPSTKWKETYFRNPQDKKWYPGETLPVAIGQGAVSTTPVQVARALAAVVNGGKLLKPRVVQRVVADDGRVLEERTGAPEISRVIDIDPSILQELRRSMVGVVEDKRGTGHAAALPAESKIRVGGKTGTAQVSSRESGVTLEDHAWFAGYGPADDPEIVVVALVENGGHGGAAAAPIARQVFMQYFNVQEPPKPAPQVKKKNKPVEVSHVDH